MNNDRGFYRTSSTWNVFFYRITTLIIKTYNKKISTTFYCRRIYVSMYFNAIFSPIFSRLMPYVSETSLCKCSPGINYHNG